MPPQGSSISTAPLARAIVVVVGVILSLFGSGSVSAQKEQTRTVKLLPATNSAGSSEVLPSGWSKRLSDSSSDLDETAWIVRAGHESLYFEAVTQLTGYIRFHREDLKGCRFLSGKISVDGNGPKIRIFGGGALQDMVLREDGQTTPFRVPVVIAPDHWLSIHIRVEGEGKIWGHISQVTAEECS